MARLLALAALAAATPALAGPVDFNRDIKPILAKNCFACHGPDDGHRSASLRLDLRDEAIKSRKKGPAVVPNKPDASRILARVSAKMADERMPPAETGNVLTAEQIDTLKKWIAEGAAYAEHWAFVKPTRPEPPRVADAAWATSALDKFIFAKLEAAGLKPSAEADRHILIRRLSLDLRGLPPTPQEVENFVADTSPKAYEKVVDRFLADPAFGERWARVWLDLARYADSAGYGSDPLRLNVWRYRDWVIEAFNKNLPYDRFTLQQLAGDLLPGATLDQRMATAFHRNTMTNTEGGTDDEEFRVAAVKDRVDTTFQVWTGLTVGCAKCHNHKFDPVTQKEYYRLFAVFNQTADADRGDEFPVLEAPTPEVLAKVKRIDARLAELRKELETAGAALTKEQAAWESSVRPFPSGTKIDATPKRDGSSAVASFAGPVAGATGLRIERSAGPLTAKRVRLVVGAEGKAPAGRFVRVEQPGKGQLLSLAEVQAFRGGANVATKGSASQSSTDYEGEAKRAIDGNTNGNYYQANSVTHTKAENDPWWEVRLAESGPVERIAIWNRTDGGTGSRLVNFRVTLLDDDRKVVWSRDVKESPSPSAEWRLGGPQPVKLADAFAETTDGTTPARTLVLDDGKTTWVGGGPLKVVFDQPFAVPTGIPVSVFLDGTESTDWTISSVAGAALGERLKVPATVRAVLDVPADKRTKEQLDAVAKHYHGVAPALQKLRDEIAASRSLGPRCRRCP